MGTGTVRLPTGSLLTIWECDKRRSPALSPNGYGIGGWHGMDRLALGRAGPPWAGLEMEAYSQLPMGSVAAYPIALSRIWD